ncbi:hypothetical protein [Flavobacterium sp.]|uniref:hypothetical protein n=1 Tax=Flavobacterium sp. TaxID=239 RepID=UPI004033CED0
MKKLLLSIAILAVMTFAACSEDEKDYTPNYLGCMHCAIPDEEGYEVCVDDSGNAFVGNADTGIQLAQYFALFCDNDPEIPGQTPVYTDCVMCVGGDQDGVKICKGVNGNAYTFAGNTGTDTATLYADYLAAHCDSSVVVPVTLTNCVDCMAMNVSMGEVCKGSNNNAYLEGQDTGMTYTQYINTIEQAGGSCE